MVDLGLLRIQPAELTKLSLFCYIANYLVRKGDEVRNNLRLPKPMGVILVVSGVTAGTARPWYGGGVVCDYAGDVVHGGSELWQFIAIIGMGISAVVLLILAEPYRIRRVTAFWNPWEDRWRRLSVNAIVDGVWS